MNVARLLTHGGWLGIFLLASTAQPLLAEQGSESTSTRYIVRLKKDHGFQKHEGLSIQEAASERGLRLKKFRAGRLGRKRSIVLPQTGFLITEDLSESEVQELRDNPDVAYVEQDIQWTTQESGAGSSDSLPTSFEQAPWTRDLMGFSEDAPSPYLDPNYSQNRTIVAVIDTGTREDHPFLAGALEPNMAEVNGREGVDDDGNGFVDDTYGANAITRRGSADESYSSHGTHVSGLVKIIRDHAISEFPAARQISILPVRFIGDDGSGSTAAAITAMEYAASRGAKVINASWGAKGQNAYSQALYETFVSLYNDNDIFFAVAAGNADGSGSNNNDNIPHFPANYNVPSLMSVASATPNYGVSGGVFRLFSLTLSDFSNYGRSTVHIAAPGDYSDGRGGTRGVLSAYSGYGPWGNLYVKKQGTSMASPLIAGIAGVMRAVNPRLTSFEVKDLMLQSAKQYSSLSAIKGSSLAHARNAILLASTTSTQGTKPRTPSNPVNGSSGGEEFERPSGCAGGTVANASGGNGSANSPMGGNSLGLFMVLFGIWAASRQRKSRKSRVK